MPQEPRLVAQAPLVERRGVWKRRLQERVHVERIRLRRARAPAAAPPFLTAAGPVGSVLVELEVERGRTRRKPADRADGVVGEDPRDVVVSGLAEVLPVPVPREEIFVVA